MSVLIQCDRDGCPSQGREESLLEGWLVVHPMGGEEGPQREFCSRECLVMHFAKFEVPETMPSE